MTEDQMPMKEKLLETVAYLREDEINLEETPVIFKWNYPEEPHIQFQLMIKETETGNEEVSKTLH